MRGCTPTKRLRWSPERSPPAAHRLLPRLPLLQPLGLLFGLQGSTGATLWQFWVNATSVPAAPRCAQPPLPAAGRVKCVVILLS